MKVICKKNTAADFDLQEVRTVMSNAFKYHLEIGKEYLVMGMMIRKDSHCLYYLIDQGIFMDWRPYLLFDISDNSLPNDWYANVYDKKRLMGTYFISVAFTSYVMMKTFMMHSWNVTTMLCVPIFGAK